MAEYNIERLNLKIVLSKEQGCEFVEWKMGRKESSSGDFELGESEHDGRSSRDIGELGVNGIVLTNKHNTQAF